MTAFITLWLLQNNLRWFGKKQFKISRPSHAASFFASFSYWWKQRALTDDKCTVNMSSFYLFTKRPLRFRIDVIFIYTATLWDVHKKEKSNKTWRLSIYYFSLYWAWNVYVCVTTHVYVQFYIQEYLFVCICVCFCEGVLPYGKCVCMCVCVYVWLTVVSVGWQRDGVCWSVSWPCITTFLLYPTSLPSSLTLYLSYSSFHWAKYILVVLSSCLSVVLKLFYRY